MACHNKSVIVSRDDIWSIGTGNNSIFDNPTSSAGMYEEIGITLLRVTSPTFWIFCLGIAGNEFSRNGVVEEPVVDITIPIPCRSPLPSIEQTRWSTLSADHWLKLPCSATFKKSLIFSLETTHCLYRVTSSELQLYPRLESSFCNHFDPKTWSISTAKPNGIGGSDDLGFMAWTILCPILACFRGSLISVSMNTLNNSGNHSLLLSTSAMSLLLG